VGTMTALTGNGSLGVLSIVVLFVIGFVLMLKTPDSRERAS
jgi:UMF1 family MFS transporter